MQALQTLQGVDGTKGRLATAGSSVVVLSKTMGGRVRVRWAAGGSIGFLRCRARHTQH